MIFTATCCYALLGMALCLAHESYWRWEILGAFLFALCANTRIIGIMFPLLLLGYRVIRDAVLAPIWKKHGNWTFSGRLSATCCVPSVFSIFLCTYYPSLMGFSSDISGRNPREFSDYNVWPGSVYFLGNQYAGSGLPWYYLPVWLGVSVPLWYLLAMLTGIAGALAATIHNRRRLSGFLRASLLGPGRWFVLCLVVATLPVAAVILMHSTLYNGWRHMYFIFPELVVVALFGVQWLFRLLRARRWPRRLLAGGMAVLLAGQACWIGWMHPFEKFYLNPVGQTMSDLLEKDYWYESTTAQIQHILDVDDSRRINLSDNSFSNISAFHYFAEEDARRIFIYSSLTYTEETPIDYIIDEALGPVSSTFPGFTPVYELRGANGMLISTIYMREEALMERFGGSGRRNRRFGHEHPGTKPVRRHCRNGPQTGPDRCTPVAQLPVRIAGAHAGRSG